MIGSSQNTNAPATEKKDFKEKDASAAAEAAELDAAATKVQ